MKSIFRNKGATHHPDIEHFRLEPFIDLATHKVIGYEVLSQLRDSLNAEDWFSDLSGHQQIEFLLNQIRYVAASVDDFCFYNLSIDGFINLGHSDIEFIASFNNVRLEVSDASALRFLDDKTRYIFFKNTQRLRYCGVQVWVDDLSIDDLICLPVFKDNFDGVKIDKVEMQAFYLRSLIEIVRTVLGGVPVLIEGVESERDLRKSIGAGANFAQGYYWKGNNIIPA